LLVVVVGERGTVKIFQKPGDELMSGTVSAGTFTFFFLYGWLGSWLGVRCTLSLVGFVI
jgi:hypothetical protein